MSCASSTCALPSRLRACRAKMSRINAVRSITFTPSRSSSERSCPGVSSWSRITESAPLRCTCVVHLLELAPSDVGRGVGLAAGSARPARPARRRRNRRAPRARRGPPRRSPDPTPTSTAFSRTAGRHVADSGDSSTCRSIGRARVRLVELGGVRSSDRSPHRGAELAEHLVQPHLVVGRVGPVADDQAAGQPEAAPPGTPAARLPGITTAPGGHPAAVLDRLRAGHVDHRRVPREHHAGAEHGVRAPRARPRPRCSASR